MTTSVSKQEELSILLKGLQQKLEYAINQLTEISHATPEEFLVTKKQAAISIAVLRQDAKTFMRTQPKRTK